MKRTQHIVPSRSSRPNFIIFDPNMLDRQINGRNIEHIVMAAMTSISAKPSSREPYMVMGVIFFRALLMDSTSFHSGWKYLCTSTGIKLETLRGKLWQETLRDNPMQNSLVPSDKF
jgi:hypothetical protein